jgi:hypothetical protein
MIIAFAFSIIGSLLILANYKFLRKKSILIISFIFALLITALGIYFIRNAPPEMNYKQLFPMFTPLVALIMLYFTQRMFKNKTGKELILFLKGLFPVRHEERYISNFEIRVTYILLALSVVIPYLILEYAI